MIAKFRYLSDYIIRRKFVALVSNTLSRGNFIGHHLAELDQCHSNCLHAHHSFRAVSHVRGKKCFVDFISKLPDNCLALR